MILLNPVTCEQKFKNVLRHLKWDLKPSCFNTTAIILVPKKPTGLNDCHPAALTPIMMKCFKRLVKDHVVSRPPSSICLPPK